MPIWEGYDVNVTIGFEIRVGGQLIAAGGHPGEGKGTSNREVKGLTMEEAVLAAIGQSEERVKAAVQGIEAQRRRELGYRDGN